VDEVMSAAASALTRISRDIADHGRPDPEAEEARAFTDHLLRAFAVERDVVPIESLYFEGDSAPMAPPTTQPRFASPAPLGPLELVSHGEHLCQIAELIGRSRFATERDLRLYHLLGTLRMAGPPGSDPVSSALGVFARATREALASGVAARATESLVQCLREAGELLRSVADADDRMQVSRRLLDVAHRLDSVRTGAEPVALPPAEPMLVSETDADVVPIESLAYDADSDVVPIESLAPSPGGPNAMGLEATFATFERLQRERGPAPITPSLDGLLSRGAPANVRQAEEAVAIEMLCYRGRSALERADAVRRDLSAALARPEDLATIRPLLQELLDLVPLALAES
jgi:hypothetical protein